MTSRPWRVTAKISVALAAGPLVAIRDAELQIMSSGTWRVVCLDAFHGLHTLVPPTPVDVPAAWAGPEALRPAVDQITADDRVMGDADDLLAKLGAPRYLDEQIIRTGRKGITVRTAFSSVCQGCKRTVRVGEPVTMVEGIGWVCDGCDAVDAI